MRRHDLTEICQIFRNLSDFGNFSDFWKFFRFLENFQIFGKVSVTFYLKINLRPALEVIALKSDPVESLRAYKSSRLSNHSETS